MLTNLIPVIGTELTGGSKGMLMAVVTVSGILIVFLVLVLLIFIFYAYGGIFQSVTASKAKKKADKEATKTAEVKTIESEVSASEPDALSDGEIPGEIIAVIAAAVASLGDGKSYTVKKVRRAPTGGRSAWAASGIFENTRPF